MAGLKEKSSGPFLIKTDDINKANQGGGSGGAPIKEQPKPAPASSSLNYLLEDRKIEGEHSDEIKKKKKKKK